MGAVYDYGQRKYQKGFEKGFKEVRNEVIRNLYDSGMSVEDVSKKTKTDVKEVMRIILLTKSSH